MEFNSKEEQKGIKSRLLNKMEMNQECNLMEIIFDFMNMIFQISFRLLKDNNSRVMNIAIHVACSPEVFAHDAPSC